MGKENEVEMVECSLEMAAKHILDPEHRHKLAVDPSLVVIAYMDFEPLVSW